MRALNPSTPGQSRLNNFLTVTSAGPLMLIQDLGRPRVQHLGFSDCGPMDEFSHRWANKLLDNDEQCATIEITLGQCRFRCNQPCLVAITGAHCAPKVNNVVVSNWSTLILNKGDVLSFAIPRQGLRTYLAIQGGFQTPLVHGSRACNIQEKIGGNNGKAINKNDDLFFLPQQLKKHITRFLSPQLQQHTLHQSHKPLIMHFIASRNYLTLPLAKQHLFSKQIWHISQDANRMGYRLRGDSLQITTATVTSRATNYGSIQLPSDGQPIVLMKDRQTIGGYPILGTVIKTDLFRLGQLRPGQSIQFVAVSIAFAKQQWQQMDI